MATRFTKLMTAPSYVIIFNFSFIYPIAPTTMVVAKVKTNPLIADKECPGARQQLQASSKPILVHGGGAFQSFSSTAMATVSTYF